MEPSQNFLSAFVILGFVDLKFRIEDVNKEFFFLLYLIFDVGLINASSLDIDLVKDVRVASSIDLVDDIVAVSSEGLSFKGEDDNDNEDNTSFFFSFSFSFLFSEVENEDLFLLLVCNKFKDKSFS